MKQHGLVEPLVFNRRTGNLVSGHQRLGVIDELEGSDDYTLQISVVDIPEEKEMSLNLLLNNRAAQGEDNLIMLQNVFEEMIASGTNVEDAGYTTTDMQQLFPDVFLTGEVAEQFDAEKAIVDQLNEMSETGRDYEGKFRDDAGLPPTKAMLDKQAREDQAGGVEYEDVAGPDGEPDSPEPGQDWKNSKEDFIRDRNRTKDNNAEVMNETDVMLTLSFQTKAQMISFMHAFEIDQGKRYLDIHDIGAAFGVEL